MDLDEKLKKGECVVSGSEEEGFIVACNKDGDIAIRKAGLEEGLLFL